MGSTSTLDPDNFPHGRARKTQKGHDVRALGPSDESTAPPGDDIDVDRVVGPEDAGLGYGLDEAEEAWLEHDRGEH
jgi:hypothetical protein